MSTLPSVPPRVMRGASGVASGSQGYVPTPTAGQNAFILRGDGIWAAQPTGTIPSSTGNSGKILTTDGTTPAWSDTPRALTAVVNPRSARGGVAFDGSTNTRIYSTLTGQNIGTDACALSKVFRVPTSAPSARLGLIGVGSSATDFSAANSFALSIANTTGDLEFSITNGAGVYGGYKLTNFISNFGGKIVHVVVVRSGAGVPVLYVNGVVQTTAFAYSAGAYDWAGTITSTYLGIGYYGSTTVYAGVSYAASLYNLSLSQADVTEIYELGGAVPERFKFGSQVDSSSATSWASALLAYDTFTGVSAAGFTATAASGTKVAQKLTGRALTSGRQWLATFTATLTSGAVPQIIFYDDASLTNESSTPTNIAAGANAMTVTLTRTATAPSITFRTIGASSYAIASFVLKQVGAVVHLDGDSDGLGFQWHDYSTNKLDAVLTTTGPSWTNPVRMGYVRALSDGTTTPQQLTGATSLPANCQLVRIRARSLAGTPSITLGSSSGGSQYVASVALTAAWKLLTIALTDGMVTANSAVWLTASAANVVEVQIAYETLT